jgi:hypothetical protein
MIKKRTMAKARWFDLWIDTDNMKRLDTGYADNQPNWPYWVQPKYYTATDWHDMHKWMQETFGDSNWANKGLWVGSDRKYWFRKESDRTFFILRWS